MGITRLTTEQEITRAVAEALQRQDRATVRTMQYVGEAATNEARSRHTYTDQTGNLTSSMGYAVVADGKPVAAGASGGAAQGAQAGSDYLKSLVANYPRGFALVVAAGMEYASYVSARGYDVLDSAEAKATSLAKAMLKP